MGEFLSYSITSGLLMLAMYLAYRLFLAKDNQHDFNRGVLLMIYFLSFATTPVMSALKYMLRADAAQRFNISDLKITDVELTETAHPLWGKILIWVFIIGMAIVTCKTIFTWIRLIRIIKSSKKIQCDGYILAVTDCERYAPFSWMRYVVISRKDYEVNSGSILAHEMKHVAAHHWVDLLIAQAVCIVNWFNPAAWLMRDELMLVHEYQADMAVIDHGFDPQQYQMLLIKKAVGSRFPSLANSLNHSKLKKRITMMYKEKSGAGHRFKALALVPMLAMALGVASVPAVRAAVTTISSSEISTSEVSENTSQGKISGRNFRLTGISVNGTDVTVDVKGENLGNHINVTGGKLTTDNISVDAKSLQCQLVDGVACITAVFSALEQSDNQTMTLNVNGRDISFNLNNTLANSDIKVLKVKSFKKQGSTDEEAPDANVTSEPKSQGSFDYYINGKKASQEEMNALNPHEINAITVDKKNNAIRVELK